MFVTKIVEEIIAGMNNELNVVEKIGANTIRISDIKWLPVFFDVIIDGVRTEILGIDPIAKTISFSSSISDSILFEIPKSELFVGTRMKTSEEWIQFSRDERDKIPLIWFCFNPNPTSRRSNDDLNPVKESWNNIQLFFISEINRKDWFTKEILSKRVEFLYEWNLEFLRSLDRNSMLDLSGESSSNLFPVFGVESSNGSVKDILDSNLAAVSCILDIDSLYDDCKC